MKISCPHSSYNADLLHDIFEKPSDPTAILKHSCTDLEVWMLGLRMYFVGPASDEAKNAPQSSALKKITETDNTAPIPLNSPNQTSKPYKAEHKIKLSRIFITAPLKSGKLVYDRKTLAEQLSEKEDCDTEITIERVRKNRSIPQNKWYWGCIIPMIAKEIGEYNEEEIHAVLKTMHNKKTMVIKGKEMEVVRDTKGLNVEEFGIYCEKVRTWAAQFLNVSIPDPDPQWLWRETPELVK